MSEYRILSYAGGGGEARPGLLVGEIVVDLARAGLEYGSTLAILADWNGARPRLGEAAARCAAGDGALAEATRPLAELRLLAPLLYPGNVFCAASNYADHAKEMGGGSMPDKSVDTPSFLFPQNPCPDRGRSRL